MALVDEKSYWYREPFVWMLIVIPLTAVVGGIVTLVLAITSNDGLVVDDYYWHGKQINRVLGRDLAALERGIDAELLLDYDTQIVTVRFTARKPTALPAQIRLSLLHATRAGFDRTVELNRTADGSYHGLLPTLVAGHWYLQLENDDWRLVGSIRVPGENRVLVTPTPHP
jgi:hypothetical protein